MTQKQSLQEFQSSMLDRMVEVECAGREDEKDLNMLKRQFVEKMLDEENGQELLTLLGEGEFIIAERMQLILEYSNLKNEFKYAIPSWLRLVAHLKTVYKA